MQGLVSKSMAGGRRQEAGGRRPRAKKEEEGGGRKEEGGRRKEEGGKILLTCTSNTLLSLDFSLSST